MGYDISIVRLDETTGEAQDITRSEWLGLVDRDASLRLDSSDPLLVSWGGHPSLPEVCLFYSDGSITVKNPDQATRDKVVLLARCLNAVVQGDDGELYGAVGMAADLAPGTWEGAYHYGKPLPGSHREYPGRSHAAPGSPCTLLTKAVGSRASSTTGLPCWDSVQAGHELREASTPSRLTLWFTKTYLQGLLTTPVHYRGQVKNARLVEGTWSFHASGEPVGGVWEASWGSAGEGMIP